MFPFLVRFVLSSCRFPFVSCIAFFAFLLVSLLSLMVDYIILLFHLGATPPCALCEPQACVFPLRSVFFLAFQMLTYFYFFFSSFPFSTRFGHSLFHPVFFLWVLCLLVFGFCCDSFNIYELTVLFLSEIYDLWQLLCLLSCLLFVLLLR